MAVMLKTKKKKLSKKPMSPTVGGISKPTAKRKIQKTAAQMGSKPVQETDTGPGGMTATGSKKRLGKAVVKNQKKFGTRVGTGSVSARKPSGKK